MPPIGKMYQSLINWDYQSYCPILRSMYWSIHNCEHIHLRRVWRVGDEDLVGHSGVLRVDVCVNFPKRTVILQSDRKFRSFSVRRLIVYTFCCPIVNSSYRTFILDPEFSGTAVIVYSTVFVFGRGRIQVRSDTRVLPYKNCHTSSPSAKFNVCI